MYHDGSIARVSGVGLVYHYDDKATPWNIVPIDQDACSWSSDRRDCIDLRYFRHFSIHDACWALLESLLPADQVPVEELWAFFSMRLINDDLPSTWTKITRFNPTQPSWVKSLLGKRQNPPKPAASVVERRQRPLFGTRDPFIKFPPELCLYVLRELSSKDYYSLRLASRSMEEFFFSPTFWKTRFELDSDCGFVDLKREIHGYNAQSDGLRAIYRGVRRRGAPARWKWKRRVLSCCRQIREESTLNYQVEKCLTGQLEQPDIQKDDWTWKAARALPS